MKEEETYPKDPATIATRKTETTATIDSDGPQKIALEASHANLETDRIAEEEKITDAILAVERQIEGVSEGSPALMEFRGVISDSTEKCRQVLRKIIAPFGKDGQKSVIHTAGPESQFHNEIWMRDTAFAILNILAEEQPEIVLSTLEEIFKHQREDGALPLRLEKVRHWARYIPILNRIPSIVNREEPYAVYENVSLALPARDTVPTAILAVFELYRKSTEGKEFAKQRWEQMKKSLDREASFMKDGLISGDKLQDWADSIMRSGKLSDVNILYYRALRGMSVMARDFGSDGGEDKTQYDKDAASFKEQAEQLRQKIMDMFWDDEKGCFKAGENDERLDTVSNIMAILFVVSPEKAVLIEESIERSVTAESGLLKNFDVEYPESMIAGRYKLGRIVEYHNSNAWPWVTCMNILAEIKIAKEHRDPKIRRRFKDKAIADFIRISKIFAQNGDTHEILDPMEAKPIHSKLGPITLYRSSPSFLGSAASYAAVVKALRDAGFQ